MKASAAEDPMDTIMCPPHDLLAYQKLKTSVPSMNTRKLRFLELQRSILLKMPKKYVSKYMIFTYLLRVLKDMQKKNWFLVF